MRLIDADALYNEIEYDALFRVQTAKDIVELIFSAPTVEAEPVRHGKWENYPSHNYRRCSLCKVEWEKPIFNIRANYCPNCGSKME